MKKRILSIGCILLIFTCGCSNNSEQLLHFKVWTEPKINIHEYDNLATSDYYSEDLVIAPTTDVDDNEKVIDAGAALCVNTSTNELIYADHAYEKLYPASLTKLMTALVVLDHAELTDQVTVGYDASHISEPGAKLCGLKEGDVLKLEDLLAMLLIYSGNDAGIAIAEHVAGSEEEFCKLMNQKAIEIGAIDSHFVNSHGLHDSEQYSTAYDLYLIFHQLLQYDKFIDIISKTSYKVTYHDVNSKEINKTYKTTNKYLLNSVEEPEGLLCLGGKTGTTSKAGYCLILYSKDDRGQNYISIILKDSDTYKLYDDMNELLKLCIS